MVHEGGCLAMAYAPSKNFLISAGRKGDIRTERDPFFQSDCRWRLLKFSSWCDDRFDGRGDRPPVIHVEVIDLRQQQSLNTFVAHRAAVPVRSIVVDDVGGRFFTGSNDGDIKVTRVLLIFSGEARLRPLNPRGSPRAT